MNLSGIVSIGVLLGVCVLCGAPLAEAQSVVISEFMADNDSTLADGDGEYSDWIELYNTTEDSVDLEGWYLTDDPGDLTQWAFPAVSIGAGEFLVVMASGQDVDDYVDSLGYLHTNFKLSKSGGESIFLLESDGATVAHAFESYPEQEEDVSYGLGQDASTTYIIAEEESAKALIPSSEPASDWNTAAYSDTGWLSGATGVGFEEMGGSSYGSMINLDVSDMFPGSFTCYIRVAFTVDDPGAYSLLTLRMKYDDGFVAYINGTEVAAANGPASPGYNDQASGTHEGTAYEDFTISNPSSCLQAGENVLAIHALDYPSGTPDIFIMPVLNGNAGGEIQLDSALYLRSLTPGAANVSGVLGYVADTTFSVDRGFFSESFAVEIGCDTEGASIYYTTDATAPTTSNGVLYTEAITISKTTVLRAAAFMTGYQPSNVDTQTYFFLEDIIAQGSSVSGLDPDFPSSSVNGQGFDYGMDTAITQSSTYAGQMEDALLSLPSFSLVTDPDNLFDSSSGIYVNASEEGEAWERETSIELIHPDGSEGFQINGGIRIRGASSTSASNPKHSFRLFFRSEYGASRLNYALFGDEGADSFKRMDLRTGQNFSWANQSPAYATWLYDIFTRDTHRDMDQPYTRGEYYHLYINGMYWGLYQTEERCDSRYAESYYGDDNDDFDAVKADADTGDLYALDGTRDAYEELWAGLSAGVSSNEAYFALQGMNTDGRENSSYTRLLDVDNIIDYMLLVYFTANRDSPIGPPHQATMPRNLTAVYNRLHPDGFKFVAHDNEHSLEISEGVYHNRFTQSLSSSFDGIDRMTPWWIHLKLMNNDEYALRFADHVHAYFFNGGALTAAETGARLEARSEQIYAAVVAESARWGDSAGTLRTRDDDWLTQVNWLLNTYMPSRTDIVLGQIESKGWYPSVAAPEFNQHGGAIDAGFSLAITGSGAIYYTTDGADPREVGGGVAGALYGSAIALNRSAHVKARGLSGGVWSALTEATFVLNGTCPLVITEIMYHPAAAESGSSYSASDFEFIELQNTSEATIGLAGVAFNGGIYFDFSEGAVSELAPGECVLLVSNLDAFAERYPDWESYNIAGEYSGAFYTAGALNNGGEELSLVDGFGESIEKFSYQDDWYDTTDGEGYSLVRRSVTGDASDPYSWSASSEVDGSPGVYSEGEEEGEVTVDEGLADFLKITEIMYNPADDGVEYIELQNIGADSLDLSGVYFSEGIVYTFPDGASLAAGAYYVIAALKDEFAVLYPDVQLDDVFGNSLSNGGETLALSGADGVECYTMTYDDETPWPTSPDGLGFSLVIIDAAGDPSDPYNWRASSSAGGSPEQRVIVLLRFRKSL